MLCVVGTSIERIVAVQFATDTGANLSLHDLSVRNLSADYDHFLDCEFARAATKNYVHVDKFIVYMTRTNYVHLRFSLLSLSSNYNM